RVTPRQNGSLTDMTIGEVWLGLKRYQPFILAVLAVVLVVWLLPGKPSTSNSNLTNGSNSESTTAGESSSGGGGNSQAAGASGTSGGGGSTAARAARGESAGGGVSINTGQRALIGGTDQHCDTTTKRQKFPTLYAAPCVPAFSGNNGGSTYNGVTATTITVAAPYNANSAATAAALAQDTDTHAQIVQTA